MKIPKDIVGKARRLDVVRRLEHGLEKEEKELAEVLRSYVEERGGMDERGYWAVWDNDITVFLEPRERLEVDPEELFKRLKKKAFVFLAVRVKELKSAIKDKIVKMSEEELENLTYHGEDTPRLKVKIKTKNKN